jgi:DNA-binding MarR family transcriptional regulator
MDDLQSILETYKHRKDSSTAEETSAIRVNKSSSTTESVDIFDLFFDQVLVHYKLSRIDILVLIYIYRRVWLRPNLYRTHGISPILSYTDLAKVLNVEIDNIYNSLKTLENMGLIETIRSGQYFVRRFFTAELDKIAHQTYDDFEV